MKRKFKIDTKVEDLGGTDYTVFFSIWLKGFR